MNGWIMTTVKVLYVYVTAYIGISGSGGTALVIRGVVLVATGVCWPKWAFVMDGSLSS